MKRRDMPPKEALVRIAWAVALDHERRGVPFGYGEIAVGTKVTAEYAARIVRVWVADGLAEQVAAGKGLRNLYRLKAGAALPEALPGRTPEDNVWTAMRGLRSFRPTDLAAHATTDTVQVDAEFAQAYCRMLLSAGYLAVVAKAVPGRREAIYRLVRDTGPRPPREKRVRAVVDPNLDDVIVIGGPA